MTNQMPNPFQPPTANLHCAPTMANSDFPRFSLKHHKWALFYASIFASPLFILFLLAIFGCIYKQLPFKYYLSISLFILPTILWIFLVTCHWAKENGLPSLYQSILRNLTCGLAWVAPFMLFVLFGMRLLNPNESLELLGKDDTWFYIILWSGASLYAFIIERVLFKKKKRNLFTAA